MVELRKKKRFFKSIKFKYKKINTQIECATLYVPQRYIQQVDFSKWKFAGCSQIKLTLI